MIIEELKSHLSDKKLKDKITIESVASVLENLISGNEYLNNVDVGKLAITDKITINDSLIVKENAEIEDLTVKSLFNSKQLNITDDNELIFNDESVIRIKDSPVAFKAKDIFEVIAFLKYIMKVCGKQMELCDYNTLLKETANKQKLDLMKLLKERFNKNKDEIIKLYSPKTPEESKTKTFIFKQKNLNQEKIPGKPDSDSSKEIKIDKEIEKALNYEFKVYSESQRDNGYESFLSNEAALNKYIQNYYYEGY